MFENYFATVRRGQRIENNCTLLRNVLKVMKKPMSMREIRAEIPSIQLTDHMVKTLVDGKALKREIRAEEIIDKPFDAVVLKRTLETNKDGTMTARLAWTYRPNPIKIYDAEVREHDWLPEVYAHLRGIEKVQVHRAYYEWIGD